MEFIDLKKQYTLYKEAINSGISNALDHGQYIMGPEVKELEEALAAFVGAKYCITTSSGTDSLLIALMALDIGPGDEVITVPFTWISTAEVIALLGAKPVFVDIEPDTYNIDVNRIEEAITPKTKAIIPVDLYGQMPDYGAISSIANKYNIAVIQDAAQSFGATQNGVASCRQGLFGATSFFPSKPLGCYGDGGALFTDDDTLAKRAKAVRTHGGEVRHHHTCVGLNGRLDTLQAAVLLAKLPHFTQEIAARQAVGKKYDDLLQGHCAIPKVMDANTHVYAQYTVRVDEREYLQAKLRERGVPTAVYYPKCLHEQPVFKNLGYAMGDFPVAEQAAQEVLSLPMHPWISDDEQHIIAECVKQCCLVTTP